MRTPLMSSIGLFSSFTFISVAGDGGTIESNAVLLDVYTDFADVLSTLASTCLLLSIQVHAKLSMDPLMKEVM